MVKMHKHVRPSTGIIVILLLLTTGLGVITLVLLLSTIFSGSLTHQNLFSNASTKYPNLIKLSATPSVIPTSTLSPTQTNTPTPQATPTSTFTPTATINPWIEERVQSMSLSELVGQLLMVGIDGQRPEQISCSYIWDLRPGGIVYRNGNVIDPDQTRQLSAAIQSCLTGTSPYVLIAVDHEGQYVNRFESGVNYFPPAMAIGASGDPEIAFNVAHAQGLELSYSGVNTVLGPVADVLTNLDNTVISQRSYGGDPQQVAKFVNQAVLGYQKAGIAAVVKHYPGHGGVSGDSHSFLPIDYSDLATLEANYLPPFQAGIDAGAQIIMTAHVAFPSIDPSGVPATLSSILIDQLREKLDYNGVVITDSMGMGAITNNGLDIPNASLMALQAGVDMLLLTSPDVAIQTKSKILTALANGELSEDRVKESVRRILSVKVMLGLDIAPQPASSPELLSGAEIAFDAGYHAPAVIKDENHQIPLPVDEKNILVIAPPDGWGLDNLVISNLSQSGYSVTITHYGAPWNGSIDNQALLADLVARTSRYDLTILFTWEAHLNRFRYGDSWQANLANQLLDNGTHIIIVALKSPTDLLEFPQAPVYIATFGTTPGQLHALVDILTGVIEPPGEDPLDKLENMR